VHLLPNFTEQTAELGPRLAGRLADPSPFVRANAAVALGEFGPAASPALDELAKALTDFRNNRPIDHQLTLIVAQTMVAIRSETKARLLDLLVHRLCQDQPKAYEPAQNTLWTFGLDGCAPLERALAGRPLSIAVRRRLVETMTRNLLAGGLDRSVLDPKLAEARIVEPALRKLADDEDDETADRALSLLELLKPRAPSEAQRVIDDVFERGVKPWLVDFGRLEPTRPEVEALVKALKSPAEDVRAVAALALGAAAQNFPQEAVLACLGAPDAPAAADPPAPDPPVRELILDALIPLLKDTGTEVRSAAIHAIAVLAPGHESRYSKILPALIAAAGDRSTRCHDLSWIGPVGVALEPGDFPDSAEGKLQIAAMIALGNLGEHASEAVPVLVRATRDDDELVRWFAVQSLGQIGHGAGAAVPALTAILESGSPPGGPPPRKIPQLQFRIAAAMVLGQIGPEASNGVPALIHAMESSSSELQAACASSLGQIGPVSDDVIPALARTMTTSLESNLSAQAAASLAQIGEPAIPALLCALRNDDPDVRLLAGTTLGNMNAQATAALPALLAAKGDSDPDVADAVSSAINQIRATPAEAVAKPEADEADTGFHP
jgi:HEAT repeat protein